MIAGELLGARSAVRTHSPLLYAHLEIAAGARFTVPADASERAVFVARGPAFARGRVLRPVENVDVYPLLARLLGIPPAHHEGRADTFNAVLVTE